MRVLIAGAGVGGLTLALMLHRRGVESFEQASEIREVEVGINILPHVIEELAALDLLTKLDAAGIRTKELRDVSRLDGPVDASDAAEEADLAAAQGAEVERQAAAVRLGLPPR